MNWRPAAMLPLICALWACAEGGIRGSGISTTVQGNVVDVQPAALAAYPRRGSTGLPAAEQVFRTAIEEPVRAASSVEGIIVTVAGTNFRGRTDADGTFVVRGNFDGKIQLVFQLPEGGGSAQIALNVPAAGTLTLNNLRIDVPRAEVSAETQDVEFDGIITNIDCAVQTLTLVGVQDDPQDPDEYVLRLDTSSLYDSQGNPLTCADLRTGEQAMVQGLVNPDGTFGDATVEVHS